MKKKYFFWGFILLLLVGTFFLRIYRIPEYLTFLSDQGRDAIILKRIVTLEKLVFVGPTTSIGNVFTGPFFYYLMAPFMLLWRLDPAGPAYGIAIINTIGLFLTFIFVYKNFGKVVSLIFFVLAGFSMNQILQSRFSWNPNPVSVFSFIILICWYYSIKSGKLKWFIATGLVMGFCLQLHYVSVLLLLPIGLLTIWHILRIYILKTKQTGNGLVMYVRNILIGIFAGILSFLPLILFDVKNNFINLQTLLRASSTGEIQAKNIAYLDRFNDTIRSLWTNGFEFDWNTEVSLIALCGLSLAAFTFARMRLTGAKRMFVYACVITVCAFVPLFALLETGRHVHYYNHLYLALYFLVSLVMAWGIHQITSKLVSLGIPRLAANLLLVGVLVFCLTAYVVSNSSKLTYLTEPHRPYTQLGDAQAVAKYIIDQGPAAEYQVVGLPYYETEGHFRYYLEYYGKRPMPADALGDPTEIYVICHEETIKACQIAGNPQWQLADFQNRHQSWKQVSQKRVTNVWIVKIVHE